MSSFDPNSALLGGGLIGLASVLLMMLTGRIAGISGILGGCLTLFAGDRLWRFAFIAGLVLAPVASGLLGYPLPTPRMPASWVMIVIAGLLVGFTLALVMAAALIISGIGFALVRQQKRPMLAAQHLWPTRTDLDRPLVVGSLLFGIGWGLVGLCPGPALVNLASLRPSVMVFVLAMAAGMIIDDLRKRLVPSNIAVEDVALSTSIDG